MENYNKEVFDITKKEILKKSKEIRNGFDEYFQNVLLVTPLIKDICDLANEDKQLMMELNKLIKNDDVKFVTRLLAALTYVKTPTDINAINNLESNMQGEVFDEQLNELYDEYKKGSK